MNDPGVISLGDFQVGAAAVQVGTPVTGLDGMAAASFDVRLAYGSGGATVVVVIATSLTEAGTWIDVARAEFTTAGAEKVFNLPGTTVRASPYTVTALDAEGGVDGVLGDRLRATVTSTGAYAGSTVVSVRANLR